MHDDVLRRWQRGWSAARDWTDYSDVDGVIVVRVGEPDRRGLGRAVMTALAEAALDQGATTGLLSASPEGVPLYESLDWSPVADLVVARTRLRSVG